MNFLLGVILVIFMTFYHYSKIFSFKPVSERLFERVFDFEVSTNLVDCFFKIVNHRLSEIFKTVS